jgi:hypothetical protein
MHECKNAGMQEWKDGMQECKKCTNARMQECRNAGMQEWKNGMQE